MQLMIIGWVLIGVGFILWLANPRIRSLPGTLGALCLAPGVYIELFHFISHH